VAVDLLFKSVVIEIFFFTENMQLTFLNYTSSQTEVGYWYENKQFLNKTLAEVIFFQICAVVLFFSCSLISRWQTSTILFTWNHHIRFLNSTESIIEGIYKQTTTSFVMCRSFLTAFCLIHNWSRFKTLTLMTVRSKYFYRLIVYVHSLILRHWLINLFNFDSTIHL